MFGGLVLAFFGRRAFPVLVPIWAFGVGFAAGADWFEQLFGEPALQTMASWSGSVLLGSAFALTCYIWFRAGVVLAGAAVGYGFGAGLVLGLGLPATLAIPMGAIVGAALAVVVLGGVLEVPDDAVTWVSGLIGGTLFASGVLMLLDRLRPLDMDVAMGQALAREPIIAVVAVVVVGVTGIRFQMRTRHADQAVASTPVVAIEPPVTALGVRTAPAVVMASPDSAALDPEIALDRRRASG